MGSLWGAGPVRFGAQIRPLPAPGKCRSCSDCVAKFLEDGSVNNPLAAGVKSRQKSSTAPMHPFLVVELTPVCVCHHKPWWLQILISPLSTTLVVVADEHS